MIEIKDKRECVGCGACAQRCPKQCIDMMDDNHGFLYPAVDADRCINCGLCVKVCPVIQAASPSKPLAVLAAKNIDESVQISSSYGGLFTALARRIIDEGGTVFGARFDAKWEVKHDYALTDEDLKSFRTSKYVQSRMGNAYLQAERFLKEGRKLLFSGTPCQIAGLRLFLRKDYPNLYAIDMVCHGVPSPLIWREYLKWITTGETSNSYDERPSDRTSVRYVITDINFRDKRLGWNKFGLSVRAVAAEFTEGCHREDTRGEGAEKEILFEPYFDNVYVQAFLKNLDLRESCYACPSKCGKSGSDITLADFWGIRRHMPDAYDRNGVSLVLVNTPQGEKLLEGLPIESHKAEYSAALAGNSALEESAPYPEESAQMWSDFHRSGIDGILPMVPAQGRASS